MTIPEFQTFMLPLLQFASDDKEHSIHEAADFLAKHFQLTDEEQSILLPSGQQPKFHNRVGWARTYLKQAGLLYYPRRAFFRITDRGKEVLARNLDRIDKNILKEFPEYIAFKDRTRDSTDSSDNDEDTEGLTPLEALETAYQKIRRDLSEELLNSVINSSPGFFEKLVVELLVKMGYGGSQRDAARAVGKSGDEGIDGIIDEDRLGLDTIYIQAKRWKDSTTIGRPEIQKFVGALTGQRAKRGIFITTANFSEDAKKYVSAIDMKVVLIDGTRLANLMIDYNVGVSQGITYEIKNIDSDYFGELVDQEQ